MQRKKEKEREEEEEENGGKMEDKGEKQKPPPLRSENGSQRADRPFSTLLNPALALSSFCLSSAFQISRGKKTVSFEFSR